MLRLVVIGNGMVGHHFLEQLANSQEKDRFHVTVIGEEPHCAYDRVHLSELFQGKTRADLSYATIEQYQQWGFSVRLGNAAKHIDREAKSISLASGEKIAYDKIVLATGSYPFVPPVEGSDRDGCFTYRTFDDLEKIQQAAKHASTGVVVGGGLLGLEAANALRKLNVAPAVIEFSPRLMPAQVDPEGGELLNDMISALGVQVLTNRGTKSIEEGIGSKLCMTFQDGKKLETDMVIFSAGIRPRDELAKDAGLEMGARGGVCIDNYCQTSDADILAIGEVAAWNNCCFGLVAPGYQMAKVALSTLTQGELAFTGANLSTKLKLMGVDVGAIGDTQGVQNAGAKVYRYLDQRQQQYRKLVVSADGRHLLGAILLGDNGYFDSLQQYFNNRIELPEKPESLILPSSEAAPSLGIGALPDTACICSCHNVSKGEIIQVMEGGCLSLGDVIDATKASTGCGGCAAQLKNLVDSQLEVMGLEVSTALCAHFDVSRQALEHIIRVEGIRDFQTLVDKHGKGLGCEICKPTAANIFASVWNDYALQEDFIGLQDTNDAYLGNMQKDGSFSIVPRIAGGEITPEKLIVIGEVARDYNLYTKITGGQRIDLFGAKLNQLPEIWRRLVDAGFETGQAYGKSVRTVKSCVGSTWCRYGVQDSVGLAIEIENRYKGIRSPHKLKFAVSGCTRECAEAQSKDFGIIATEKGWNLYIAGNGGMRPRHADLFAKDLDKATLIQTLDRLMIFYIRTADRLQRTARWLEQLDGGLAYLKSVIFDDALGINEELDKQMAVLVANYQCEWKASLESPERLKRFRQTINDGNDDPTLLYVLERGQKRPANRQEKQELIRVVNV